MVIKNLQNKQIIFTCGREPTYPRNAFVQKSLEQAFRLRSITSSARTYPSRLASVYISSLRHAFPRPAAAWVGFLGQPLVPWVHAVFQAPIIFDAFISLYDTLYLDRRRFRPNSLAGKLAFWLDQYSCGLASTVVLDTQTHARFFVDTFHLDPDRVKTLYVGCDETIFSPLSVSEDPNLVLYYGSYLPLHGIETVIEAARLLDHRSSVRFRIIGEGMRSQHIRQMAHDYQLTNVQFAPPVPLHDLPGEISQAALCLGGHFSAIPKASRVIAGKTFQCLAMSKATIVGDNAANAELLTHAESAWFCPMNDPRALASAITQLIDDPALRARLGEGGRQVFLQKASLGVLSQQIRQMVLDVTSLEH